MSFDQIAENIIIIFSLISIILSTYLIILNIRIGRRYSIFVIENIKKRKYYNNRIRILKNRISNLKIYKDRKIIEKWEKQIEILKTKKNRMENYDIFLYYEKMMSFSDIWIKVKEVIKFKNLTIFSIFLFLWSTIVIYIKYYILNSFKIFKFISTKDIVDISFGYFFVFIKFLLLAAILYFILRKLLFKHLKKRRNTFFDFIPNWIVFIMVLGMCLFLIFRYDDLWIRNIPIWFYYIVFIILFQNAFFTFNLKFKNIMYLLIVMCLFSFFLPIMDDVELICDIKTRDYYFEGIILSKTSNVTIIKGSWKLSIDSPTTQEEYLQKYNVYIIQNSAIDYTECKKNKKVIWIPTN